MRYTKDDGTLAKVFNKVMKKFKDDFEHLKDTKILYLWFEGARARPGEQRVLGVTRLADKRMRDIFGYDIIIEINADAWPELSKRQRQKLAYHELCHIGVKQTKDGGVKHYIIKHDFELKRFRKEMEAFGLDESEEDFRMFLNLVRKKQKGGKKHGGSKHRKVRRDD